MNQPTEPTPIEPNPDTKADKGLHRHKKQRSSRPKEAPFWQRNGQVILLIVCLMGGFILLVNPLAWVWDDNQPGSSTITNTLIWVTEKGGSQQIGGLLLLIAFPLGIVTVRHQVIHNTQLWRRNGCPKCGRDDLRRTRRNRHDHLLNRLGIPVRRYICADCHWEGARIDEGHI